MAKVNVHIDIPKEMPQHVVNGIRFIYKQFTMLKRGVILNDPVGYDQETQVAFFLKQVHNKLDQYLKCILILCDSDKLSVWTECFKKWMPDFDELVAIDWPKPTSKKSIYVVTTDRLESYYRRDWGIVVVDDDTFLQYKLPPGVKVYYKIFITAEDLKENLQKFSLIYKWIFPDKKINVEEFIPNRNSISDIVEKRIWFDAFVQNLLIRNASSILQVSTNTYQVSKEPEYRRITRKNKDATGTKIKRSKRKLEEDNTDTAKKKNVASSSDKDTNSKLDLSNNCDESNMDVESFIRDQEPLKMDETNYVSDVDDNMSEISEKIDVAQKTLTDVDICDSENSNDMKLNYSEDTDDDAYSLETQENGVENDELIFKEDARDAIDEINEIETPKCNNAEPKSNKNDDFPQSPIADKLRYGESNSGETENANELQSKDKSKVDKEIVTKVETKIDDLDTKWEEMALKKFKGSLLDRIF